MVGDETPEVTIVGAGPTGLTLAVELLSAGVPFRIVDAATGPVHESRALAIQARTLEVLDRSGLSAQLIAAGDPARSIVMHARRATITIPLFDEGNRETSYPFILFLSQARTEQILLEHLESRGIVVERNVTVTGVEQDDAGVTFTVERPSGPEVRRTAFLIGCDGSHSAVRRATGFPFSGRGFPQSFAIADLEVDELGREQVHAFVSSSGIMFFFPLGTPATWRLLGMLPEPHDPRPLELAELQALADSYTGGPALQLRLRDPVWATRFSVQSRRVERFRSRRVFLAGDAAHIHSPAGAQGMNTGIQDAVNLGWKLAQVILLNAPDALLDTYSDERAPVARAVLRMTDRLFTMATTGNPLIAFARPRVAPAVLQMVVRSRALRLAGFRSISQIALDYRLGRLAGRGGQVRWRGLRAGDRLADLDVEVAGETANLRERLVTPRYLLVSVNSPEGGEWGESVEELKVKVSGDRPRWILVRPDGYIAGIWSGPEGVRDYIRSWCAPAG
jgi:2-polyprenyl-6-methoxyphenol hydroxylase-like FAD-dependent oxidoreductase